MVIKCTLSITPEDIGPYVRQSYKEPPLPEYITKIGPYVNKEEGDNQIIILYEFGQLKFTEAWDCIWEQLDAFRIIPGFSLSVDFLEKGRQVKAYRISLNPSSANPGVTQRSKNLSSFQGYYA